MQEGAATQDEPRAGARILALLANPLHGRILRALSDGPLRLAELHERTEWPAQTTLRAGIGNLRRLGILKRNEIRAMPFGVANELTDAGREALYVAEVLERWLARAPQPIAADSDAAKASINALAAGWSSTMVRALASEPASLTELDRQIPGVSYPSLERRLAKMRATRQVAPAPTSGRGQPFEVTDWLRHSIAPLCAAGRCERRHMPDVSASITAVEVEASFLLALPLVVLPKRADGTATLAVQTESSEASDDEPGVTGITVDVSEGRIASLATEVDRKPPTWALGTPETWLDVVIDGDLKALRLGGSRPQLAMDLVGGLHLALFGDD
jgi:DNA-binding HxlR family transcriptional regulator